jgi:hypothetical protein
VVYGGERRLVPHRGPIPLDPEIVDISDDDSGEIPAEPKNIPRADYFKLGDQPGSLLLFLRLKHDSFVESMESLRECFEPLLNKYLAVLH